MNDVLTCAYCGNPLDPNVEQCRYCGNKSTPANLGQSSRVTLLRLSRLSGDETIEVSSPGGWIGRGAEFTLPTFDAQVSKEHLLARCENGSWTLELAGTNGAILRTSHGETRMAKGVPISIEGDEILMLPKANFSLSIEVAPGNVAAERACAGEDVAEWTVVCPVCGTSYSVESEDSRIDACDVCVDAMDRMQIAQVAPQKSGIAR